MDVLVTVKAYPEPSQRHGEVVCVAGIRTDVKPYTWVRLWPIDFRGQPVADRFRKYQFVHVDASKSRSDTRPESHRPNLDSLTTGDQLSTANGWASRRPYVEPLIADSMCGILRRQAEDGTSLGAFRPAEVLDLEITDNKPWAPEQRNALAQLSLFSADRKELEWIPHRFHYRYRCAEEGCNGHRQMIIDWEIKQAYRRWSSEYPSDWQARLRDKWLGELCAPDRDTVFFAGNQYAAPRGFLVLGVWWPPRRASQHEQMGLLEGDDD